MNYAVYEKFLN